MIATTLERPSPRAFHRAFPPRPAPASFKRDPRADPWAAHDISSQTPNAETLEALEDSRLMRNLGGPYATVEEMMADILKDD